VSTLTTTAVQMGQLTPWSTDGTSVDIRHVTDASLAATLHNVLPNF
jgi:hypothetical protein